MSTLQLVEYNTKQIEQLNDLMSKMKKQCLDTINDDDFEGDLDSFDTLFNRVFKLDKLTVSDTPTKTNKKSKKKTKDPNMPKKGITPYISWLWNTDTDIGMTSIKANPKYKHLQKHSQFVSQAGKIWKSMSPKDKKPFQDSAKNDKLRYQKELLQYKQTIDITTRQTSHEQLSSQLPEQLSSQLSSQLSPELTEELTDDILGKESNNINKKKPKMMYDHSDPDWNVTPME